MADTFIGEIRAFAFNFAPRGWALCNGQLMSIQQNAALFSLLGTMYGGNGIQNFALPDLRGRIALGFGGQTTQGEVQGTESVTLLATQLPIHGHQVNAANNGSANATNVPGPTVIMGSGTTNQNNNPVVNIYNDGTTNVQLAPLMNVGGSQPHENRMPSLVVNYCIALTGFFPSRN